MSYPHRGRSIAPRILAEILDVPLPPWTRDQGFAVLGDLDARAWDVLDTEACRQLADLVAYRVQNRIRNAFDLLQRTPDALPSYLSFEDLDLGARTYNALTWTRFVERPSDLAAVSLHQLLSIPGFGIKCLLDLLIACEHLHELAKLNDPIAPAFPDHNGNAASPPVGDKPVRPPRTGRLPQVIDEPFLDQALDYLLTIGGITEGSIRAALAARLGWSGGPPSTLHAAGMVAGVTRERIRQIQERFEKLLRGRLRIPALEQALQTIRAAAPTPSEDAMRLLVKQGLTRRLLHPAGIQRAALLLEVEADYQVAEISNTGEFVVRNQAEAHALRQSLMDIRQYARPLGFITDEETRRILGDRIGEEAVRLAPIILAKQKAVALGDNWFYIRTDSREPALRLLSDMLAVAGGTLPAWEVRDGFARRLRYRRASGHHPRSGDSFPSMEAILGLCQTEPTLFSVNGTSITAVVAIDWRSRLSSADRQLVEAILESSGKVLHRDDFEQAAARRGVNQNTFNVYTTYSPFLKELGGGLWGLRGVAPDPVEVERIRHRPRVRARRVEDWEWLPSGVLRITIRISRINSLVVGIPSAVCPYLAGQRFNVKLPDGSSGGSICVAVNGSSWGYGPALARLGAVAGDLLITEFELPKQTVEVQIVKDYGATGDEDGQG
jgi:hypothetical protein